MRHGRSLASAALTGLALALPASRAAAQATPWYILDGDSRRAFVVQGGTVQSTFALPSSGGTQALYPVAWNGSNLIISNREGSAAFEYTAAGVPTGTSWVNGGGRDQLLDGGFDGTNTYAARCCGGNGVYVGDAHFGNLVQISTAGSSGVTYAGSNGHVFAADFGGLITEMTTAGAIVNSFSVGYFAPASLAWEAATNSLWIAQNSSNHVYNYSLTGQLIQDFTVPGLAGNFYGGEMANAGVTATPEPASLALLGAGLLALGGMANRRKRHPAR